MSALALAGCQPAQHTGAGTVHHNGVQPGAASDPAPRSTGWGPSQAEWAAANRAADAMSDQELAGQVIVADYGGTAAPVDLVRRYHLAGVIELGDNIASTPAVIAANKALQASNTRPWPLVISTDQEGGIVQRVGPPLTQFPTFMSYGAADDPALAERAGFANGQELRAAGFTMVFAPDADVTIGPADPTIGSRSAGEDAAVVAREVVAANAGYRKAGIVSVIKHFPGHGSVTANSHVSLPVQNRTLAQLRARDFVPFAAAVRAHVTGVMVGHIALTAVDPGVPADLSAKDVALLRNGLGFHGLITTDALNMGAITDTTGSADAAVDALRAGVDLLLMPANLPEAYQAIVAGLQDGTLSRTRVEQAAATVIAAMMHEAATPAPPTSVIGTHQALSEQVSARALTVVTGACHGPYVGPTVTPEGDATSVAAFTTAAGAAGLQVGPGGTTVALIGYGEEPVAADVVVSLDTPYVLAESPASVARLALFGSDAEAMTALVNVLTGRATPSGSLPVAVQGLDQQSHC